MIEINNLIKEYNTSKKVVHASNDITYQFKSNGLHFILGKSGCGKTTLLNILSGLDSYDSGSVIVNGYNISKLTEKELDNYRNIHIGIIFQDFNLLQDINVYDNLKIVLKLQGSKCDEKNKLEQEDIKIEQILKEVGLEGYEKRKVSELSGGEKQRIAIARCLLKKTDIIFADEPTGNLDKKTGEAILDLLKQISKNRLVIVVSHDREAAYKYGDKIIHMSDGRIVSDDKGENNQILYSFNITDNKNISKDFENLDKMKMLEVVSKYIDNSQMEGELVIKDIVKNEKTHIEEENRAAEEEETKRTDVQAYRLLNKYKLKLSYLFLKKRKLRFLFTTILLALTCVLLYFSLYISFYEKNTIMVKYLDENKVELLPGYLQCSYEDDFYNNITNDVSSGKYLYEMLSSQLSEYASISKVVFDNIMENGDLSVYNATMFFVEDNKAYPEKIKGNIPENLHEIVISDYIASKLNAKLNDTLIYNELSLKIVGIYETDYKEIGLQHKLNYGYSNPIFDFDCIYKYFATFVSEELLEEVKSRTESIEIQAGDFQKRKQMLQYLESYVSVADVGVISKDDLLEGRMPENNNEILISVDYAEKYDLLNNKYSSNQWNFSDIYKASYENTYSNMINLYDYYKEGIEIVGIVAYLPEQVQRDFYVYEDKWKEIVNDYYKYYYGSYIVNADSQYYNEIIENADKTGIYFNEPAINNILDFDNLINEIKPILYLILIISMAINFIMIGTFIHISINENKKNIGILRSLGVTMNDCIQIFALEFLIMFICSVVIVVPIIIRIISMVNNMYMDSLEGINYCIIDKSYIIFAIMFLVEITVNVLSIYIPIKAIRKKKPIEIINDR